MSDTGGELTQAVFIATSLDGFIAREDGGLDWLIESEAGEPIEDFGYNGFIATVDALVMGRNTFDLVKSFPEWPYGERPVVVLSSRELEIPAALAGRVERVSGEPREIVDELASRGYRHLYIDGGVTIQRFLDAGLIDRMIISRLPVIIGRGIPLFGPTQQDIWLEHVSTRAFTRGMVQSEYRVRRS